MSAGVECPEHLGAYDCTPFCPRCAGEQLAPGKPAPPAVLLPAWVIGDGSVIDLACEEHAKEYAADNGLVWEYPGSTGESDTGAYSYAVVYDVLESDYPHTCYVCDTYLDTALTSDGVEYVREHYPANWWHLWGVEA